MRLAPDGVVVTREHAKGDVAARGPASDLLLLVWGRDRPDAVDVFGDAALLDRWQEQVAGSSTRSSVRARRRCAARR